MDVLPSYPRRMLFDPSRHLDWRWQRALELSKKRCRLQPERDDSQTLVAARDLRRARRRCRNLDERVGYALQLAEQIPLIYEVQARILAEQDDEAIAFRCGVRPESVYWYEALLFNVRDRLKGRDWIALRATLFSPSSVNSLAATWRHYGYIGGPIILDIMLAVSQNKSFPPEVREVLGDDPEEALHLRLSAKAAIAAATLPTIPPRLLNCVFNDERSTIEPRDAAMLKIHARILRMANGAGRSRRRSTSRVRPATQLTANFQSLFGGLLHGR